MFKLFHKFYSAVVFTKPSVHYIQPKSLNVYFKNAINPIYHFFNLNKYDYIFLETTQEKEGDNNIFKLNLVATIGIDSETINLAKFETRKEAEDALGILRNKLFSPEKSIIKLLISISVLVFFLMFIVALIQANQIRSNNMPEQYQGINPQLLQQGQQQQQQPTMPTQADQLKAYQALEEARQQANKVMAEGMANPTQPAAPTVEIPQDPAVKDFVNGLNK
jgi:hypothetical protein